MFITLLIVNLIVSLLVCYIVARIFRDPVSKILQRLIAEDISQAWSKYIIFTIYVVGISGGVEIYKLEQYIAPKVNAEALELTTERWILEIYRCIIETLKSDAWMLLIFFMFVLIAYVIMKGFEMKRLSKQQNQ